MPPVDQHSTDRPDSELSLSRICDQLKAQRKRSCEFLTTQNERLDDIENRLTAELDNISNGIVEWEQFQTDLERQRIELRKEKQELERERVDRESRSCELDQQHIETEAQRRKIARKLRARKAELRTAAHGRDQELRQQLEQLEQQLEQLKSSAAQSAQDFTATQEELEAERNQRSRLESEFASARADMENSRAEETSLRQQVARNSELLNERAEQLKTLRQQLASVTRAEADHDEQKLTDELLRLQEECENLRDQVAELSTSGNAASSGSTDEELAELRSRFELAVENVRELKTRNEALEKDLASMESAAPDKQGDAGFDWESQKRQMMNQVDDADNHGQSAEERHSIESTVRLTDELVAKKDHEISMLKEQCELFAERLQQQQAKAPPDLDLGDDERVTRERQRLKELQEEWREKVRTAEVDLAVERAHSARVRQELEEKTRDLAAQLAFVKKQTSVNAKNNQQARRWLPSLGRRGNDQQ